MSVYRVDVEDLVQMRYMRTVSHRIIVRHMRLDTLMESHAVTADSRAVSYQAVLANTVGLL